MKLEISTVAFSDESFSTTDEIVPYLVFAIGYEERSVYLVQQLLSLISAKKICPIVFLFIDYAQTEQTASLLDLLSKLNVYPIPIAYNEHEKVINELKRLVSRDLAKKSMFHFDYSSMPRSWYCRFPEFIINHSHVIKKCFFWYTVGDYQPISDGFPSTGVRDIRLFSGRPTLRPSNSRTHIFGLGFDHVRTQGIMSVLDPSYYGVCYAYPLGDKEILNKVQSENEELITSSNFNFELPLHDFEFMFSKLVDLSTSISNKGDVIFVPDGPKPLILACSLVPVMTARKGIVCLHVKRHDEFFEPINVKPKGTIYGFSFQYITDNTSTES